jgi:hypothetical protein
MCTVCVRWQRLRNWEKLLNRPLPNFTKAQSRLVLFFFFLAGDLSLPFFFDFAFDAEVTQ